MMMTNSYIINNKELIIRLANRMYKNKPEFIRYLISGLENGNMVLSGKLPLRVSSTCWRDKSHYLEKTYIRTEYSIWLKKQVWE